MVIVPYIRRNAVHTAQCRMPYEICRTGARILSSIKYIDQGQISNNPKLSPMSDHDWHQSLGLPVYIGGSGKVLRF